MATETLDGFQTQILRMTRAKEAYMRLAKLNLSYDQVRVYLVNQKHVTSFSQAVGIIALLEAITGTKLEGAPAR